MKRIIYIAAFVALFMAIGGVSCVEDREFILPEQTTPGEDDGKGDEGGSEDDGKGDEGGTTETPPVNNDYPDTSWAAGELDWVFDMNAVPEIHISVTEAEWNTLLKEYDRDSNTAAYIHCDAEFKSKGETHNFVDAGLRLRGNTSRAVSYTHLTLPTSDLV